MSTNIKHVKGDLSDPSTFIENFDSTKTPIFLTHQTNCLGVMGAGVALALANRYPEILPLYQNYCKKPVKEIAGTTPFISTYTYGINVINLFGQVLTGDGRQTNYENVYTALEKFFSYLPDYPEYIIAFPKNMSSGLAGGDWNIIYTMIESFVTKLQLTNTVYIVEYVTDKEVSSHAISSS